MVDFIRSPQSKLRPHFCFIDLLCNLGYLTPREASDNISFLSLHPRSHRSAPCGLRDQGVKFSARSVETAASPCPPDPRPLPPTTPPHRDPRPSRPGANSPSRCSLFPVRASSLYSHSINRLCDLWTAACSICEDLPVGTC